MTRSKIIAIRNDDDLSVEIITSPNIMEKYEELVRTNWYYALHVFEYRPVAKRWAQTASYTKRNSA